MKTIAIINQKGGVGKTTTSANLAAAVAAQGHHVCMVDMDPQGHLSLHYGFDAEDDTPTIFDILTEEVDFKDTLINVAPNITLCPSTTDLAAAESMLADHEQRNTILRDSLERAPLSADFMMIDCPPSLGILTLNALSMADEVLIPLQPHFLAMQGLAKLLETVQLVQQHINPKLRVMGVVLCMYESVTKLGKDVEQEVRDFLASARGTDAPYANAKLFDNVVRRNIRLAECPSYGQTIFDYDSRSNGAKDYAALAKEFLEYFQIETHPIPVPPPQTRSPQQPAN